MREGFFLHRCARRRSIRITNTHGVRNSPATPNSNLAANIGSNLRSCLANQRNLAPNTASLCCGLSGLQPTRLLFRASTITSHLPARLNGIINSVAYCVDTIRTSAPSVYDSRCGVDSPPLCRANSPHVLARKPIPFTLTTPIDSSAQYPEPQTNGTPQTMRLEGKVAIITGCRERNRCRFGTALYPGRRQGMHRRHRRGKRPTSGRRHRCVRRRHLLQKARHH